MAGQREASPRRYPQGVAVMAARRIRRLLRGRSVEQREAIRSRCPQGAVVMAAHRIHRLLRGRSVEQREAIRNRRPQGAAIACGLDLQGSSAILHCLMVRLTKAVAAG